MQLRHFAMVLILITGTHSSGSVAVDIAGAAHTEALLRNFAKECTDTTFAAKFIEQSQEQIAFSLQGNDGPFSAELVEAVIQETLAKYPIKIDAAQCSLTSEKLKKLSEVRKKNLAEGKQTVQDLKKIATDGF